MLFNHKIKFNVYFIEDVKSNSQVQIDSQVNSEGKNIVRIVFGDGDIYSFVKEEKSIYKNKQKIAKNIQNFTAVRNQTSDKLKTYIEVNITIGAKDEANYTKKIDYVLKYW